MSQLLVARYTTSLLMTLCLFSSTRWYHLHLGTLGWREWRQNMFHSCWTCIPHWWHCICIWLWKVLWNRVEWHQDIFDEEPREDETFSWYLQPHTLCGICDDTKTHFGRKLANFDFPMLICGWSALKQQYASDKVIVKCLFCVFIFSPFEFLTVIQSAFPGITRENASFW